AARRRPNAEAGAASASDHAPLRFANVRPRALERAARGGSARPARDGEIRRRLAERRARRRRPRRRARGGRPSWTPETGGAVRPRLGALGWADRAHWHMASGRVGTRLHGNRRAW